MLHTTAATSILNILTITLVLKNVFLYFLNKQDYTKKLFLLGGDISALFSMIYFYLIVTKRIFIAPFHLIISGFSFAFLTVFPLLYLLSHFQGSKKKYYLWYISSTLVLLLIANLFWNDLDFIKRLDYVYLGATFHKTIYLQLFQGSLAIINCFVGLRMIKVLLQQLEATHSSLDYYYFSWLKLYFIGLISYAVFGVLIILFKEVFFITSDVERVVYSMAAYCTLSIATIFGCITQAPLKDEEVNFQLDIQKDKTEPEKNLIPDQKNRINIQDEDTQNHQYILDKLISNIQKYELHLDPELKISSLAEKVNIPSYQISKSINILLDKNFNEFINDFRIEDAKSKLASMEFQNVTILAIGLESGFNSKSSFNAQFKRRTGTTPNQYRSANLAI